jgi:hypothetical protein
LVRAGVNSETKTYCWRELRIIHAAVTQILDLFYSTDFSSRLDIRILSEGVPSKAMPHQGNGPVGIGTASMVGPAGKERYALGGSINETNW